MGLLPFIESWASFRNFLNLRYTLDIGRVLKSPQTTRGELHDECAAHPAPRSVSACKSRSRRLCPKCVFIIWTSLPPMSTAAQMAPRFSSGLNHQGDGSAPACTSLTG